MAITINAAPDNWSSVQDAMWHTVSSDNSGTVDFKFVFDVWVGGVQKIRVKQFPDPTTGKGYFNAGPIVRNSMVYDWFEPVNSTMYAALPDLNGEIGIAYLLNIGEEVSGITTTAMASGEVSGWNFAPPLFRRRVLDLSSRADKWVTNRPLIAGISLTENLFAGFFFNSNKDTVIHVEPFNHSNQTLGQTDGSIVSTGPWGFAQMNLSVASIFEELGLTIDDDVKYYDVWFNSLTGQKMRIYVKCNPKYTSYPVHFLNRWGMWDTHRFDLVSKLNLDVKRKGFEKRDYTFNGNSVDYIKSTSGAQRYYEGKINHSIQQDWNIKLTSDALTDAEYEWLAELVASPQILLEYDGYNYPVSIKNTNYDYRKYVNDRLKSLELEFEFNSSRMTHLR